MKINTLLENAGAVLAYRDLENNQLLVLQRAAAGKYDEAAGLAPSQRERDILDQLADMGLVDPLTFAATDTGAKAAQMSQRYGARDAQQIQRLQKARGQEGGFQGDRRYSTVGDASDAVDAGDDVAGLSQGARAIDRGAIV